jgi:hypothetical protein
MLTAELILNTVFGIGSSILFFYIYKRSYMNIFLFIGAYIYFKVLVRTFILEQNLIPGIPLIPILIIAELGIVGYLIWLTYKDGFTYIPIMLILLALSALTMVGIGHTFYGDIGIMLGLIMIIWVNVRNPPCKHDPFECDSRYGNK